MSRDQVFANRSRDLDRRSTIDRFPSSSFGGFSFAVAEQSALCREARRGYRRNTFIVSTRGRRERGGESTRAETIHAAWHSSTYSRRAAAQHGCTFVLFSSFASLVADVESSLDSRWSAGYRIEMKGGGRHCSLFGGTTRCAGEQWWGRYIEDILRDSREI